METEDASGQGRRSARWSGRRTGWGISALSCAVLGLAAAGAIAAATAGASLLDEVPDAVGYALAGAVPTFGGLAVVLGAVGARRERRRWLCRVAMAVGALEVLGAVVVIVVLVSATRSL